MTLEKQHLLEGPVDALLAGIERRESVAEQLLLLPSAGKPVLALPGQVDKVGGEVERDMNRVPALEEVI